MGIFSFSHFQCYSLKNLSISRAAQRMFENCSKNLLQNIDKIHYFSLFLNENHALIFGEFAQKHKLFGNSYKNFENLQKISSEICENALFYHIFQRI